MALLKAYCDRISKKYREIARECHRDHKSVLRSFETAESPAAAPTADTIIAIARSLGFSDAVCQALLGQLTWFAEVSYVELPLAYASHKMFYGHYLHLDWFVSARADGEVWRALVNQAETLLDYGALDRRTAEQKSRARNWVDFLKWSETVPQPSVDQIKEIICTSCLADAGLVEVRGPLCAGYNAINEWLQPFGFALAVNGYAPQPVQRNSREIALITLGWLSRTLNLSTAEAWPIHEKIAARFPLGIKSEGSRESNAGLYKHLTEGCESEICRFLDLDAVLRENATGADVEQVNAAFVMEVVESMQLSQEARSNFRRKFEVIIHAAEASIVDTLASGHPRGPSPQPADVPTMFACQDRIRY